MISKSKILVIHAKSGCCFWRTWQPCEAMRKQGLADIRYLDPRQMSAHDIAEGLKWCDVVNMRGLIGTEALDTMRRYQALGRKMVTDYDDLHFNVSPFNPAYRYFGLEEVQAKDPTTGDVVYLWKDGEEGFDLKRNQIKFHSLKAILEEADAVTTTTLYLKNALSEISGRADNIVVIPNAIDLAQWQAFPQFRGKYKDQFRFGWAVSNSHGEDWLYIKPALVSFLEKHPDAKFVCIGDAGMDIKRALPQGQVEWYPFSDLWEYHYPLRMVMLGLDCAIAPLADLEFNRCKSPLKFAEYTAFGWPVIAQGMEPYSSHIIHGETGLLASSIDDWVYYLDLLYKNKDLRHKLHFNASFTVKELFDLEKIAKEWANVYKEVALGEKIC